MITKLKGGSLSATYLHQGQETFIRKTVSLTKNREYGYVRWFSQLKKLQRYNEMCPGLFPLVLAVGYEGDQAYFDLEYLKSFKDIKTIFSDSEYSADAIAKINTAVWAAFDQLHSKTYLTNPGGAGLYYKEEVEQKLADARSVVEFEEFYQLGDYDYNGQQVPGLDAYLPKLKEYLLTANLESEEYIHGNPTLENTMYSFDYDRVMFVDTYEESIIDSKLLDYSQILQCSRSHYGYINDRAVTVDGNHVGHALTVPGNFTAFNQLFEQELATRNLNSQLIDILEATQFIRMLPFKALAGDLNKAKYFYVHACYLLGKVFAQ
jgi:hypothetical protein